MRGKKRFEPVGPYEPPTPQEADDASRAGEGAPMAIAEDKRTWHDAFMPTTSSQDAYSERTGHVDKEAMMPRADRATRAAQRPDARRPVDAHGFRDPLEEEEESAKD